MYLPASTEQSSPCVDCPATLMHTRVGCFGRPAMGVPKTALSTKDQYHRLHSQHQSPFVCITQVIENGAKTLSTRSGSIPLSIST
jgi:hypothetical protein